MIKLFSDIQDIKVSEKSLYKIIYQHGPITKSGIIEYLPSSLTTISRFIDSLEKTGMIRATNQETAGGRNPVEYSINPTACYAFGAYVAADVYGIGLCDIAGNVIEKTSHLFQKQTTPSDVAGFLAQFIRETTDRHQFDQERIIGIGIGVEGPILKEKGIIYHPYHLTEPGWELVPIKDLLEMKTGLRTWLGTIVELALLRELMYGSRKNCQSAAYFRIDKGIGGAFYSRGVSHIGKDDLVCQVGHMVIDVQGQPCICGRQGCLETYASIDAIVAGMQTIRPELSELDIVEKPADMEHIWEQAPQLQAIEALQYADDADVQQFFDTLTRAFVTAIVNFLYIAKPEILFLTGRTFTHLPTVVDRVVESIKQEYERYFARELHVIQSELQDDVLIQGSSFPVFNNYIQYP